MTQRTRCAGLLAAALLAVSAPAAQARSHSGGAIAIPDAFFAGPGSPYPSAINVAGEDVVTDVNVRLNHFWHDFPDEVDALLVGPGGQKAMLLSDADASSGSAGDVTLTLDDEAAQPADASVSGTYLPTDRDDGSPDFFSPPVPGGPYGNPLSVFDDPDPNGPWQLYVMDEGNWDGGQIGSWSLVISDRPQARVGLEAQSTRESSGKALVTVKRSPPTGDALRAATVSYATEPGGQYPATPGQDYTPVSGALQFPPGEESMRLEIPVLDDKQPEHAENIVLRLTGATGDARLTPTSAETIVINDDDLPLAVPLLSGPALQHVLRQRGVIVTASSNIAGRLAAGGSIAVPGGAARSVRLLGVRRTVGARQPVKLRLRLRGKALRAVRRALSRRHRLTAVVRVTATAADGGGARAATRRIKLKR